MKFRVVVEGFLAEKVAEAFRAHISTESMRAAGVVAQLEEQPADD